MSCSFQTLLFKGSRALVRVKKPKDRLTVVWGDKPEQSCFVEYALDETKVTTSAGFINLKLPCVVGGEVDKSAAN
jgi:outer membrane usher protein FimD/PapC